MKIQRTKNPSLKVSKAKIIRAVASSTAIETGRPVSEIEAKLKTKSGKFRELTLAR
jgi:hypothetical protein